MTFHSIPFILFLLFVFAVYWGLLNKKINAQNKLIVCSSYVFYGWWDWRFLSLILISTFLDFELGKRLEEASNNRKRKQLLSISLFVNLGILGFFKYFNFFKDSFQHLLLQFGYVPDWPTLNIILPVGISFYTFQTLSYTIDIYRKEIKATKDLITFAAFVAFFPQLVAGPIERAKNLLPQFEQIREFNNASAKDGLRQMLWGFFKKMVIADNCAFFVDQYFDPSMSYTGVTLWLGAFLFSFQIYGDFSGYSDIAIGTAKLFGIRLKQNFAFPYFSRNIAEFWRRWHISLSSWFRDYLYIPLGGSQKGNVYRNVFLVFLVSGFWHGANWTFIFWGMLHALLIFPSIYLQTNRKYIEFEDQKTIAVFFQMFLTFILTTLAWVFFRAADLNHALTYYASMFYDPFNLPNFSSQGKLAALFMLLSFFITMEWLGRKEQHTLEKILMSKGRYVRWSLYAFIIFLIAMYMHAEGSGFIYFQF